MVFCKREKHFRNRKSEEIHGAHGRVIIQDTRTCVGPPSDDALLLFVICVDLN